MSQLSCLVELEKMPSYDTLHWTIHLHVGVLCISVAELRAKENSSTAAYKFSEGFLDNLVDSKIYAKSHPDSTAQLRITHSIKCALKN